MTGSEPNDAKPPHQAGAERKLYGRRRSHQLRGGRRDLMEALLPRLSPLGRAPAYPEPRDGAAGSAPAPAPEPPPRSVPKGALDPRGLFEAADAVWLEIGFGGGEHLAHWAAARPDIGVIGCEHYIDGVAKLLSAVERDGLENVAIHPHDARDLIDALADASIARAFLLYPDPWPKTRHHKRRFIGDETLSALARVLEPGAELRIASDIPDYIRHCLKALFDRRGDGRRDFVWTAERADDWRRPWPGWPGTRYERKALEAGRTPCYLTFRRTETDA